jgi:chemotaxis protein histidine kinase CheA
MLLNAFIRRKTVSEQTAPLAKSWANLIGIAEDSILQESSHIKQVNELLLITEDKLAKIGSAALAHYCQNLRSKIIIDKLSNDISYLDYKEDLMVLIGLLDNNVQYNIMLPPTKEDNMVWRGWLALTPNTYICKNQMISETSPLKLYEGHYSIDSFKDVVCKNITEQLFIRLLNQIVSLSKEITEDSKAALLDAITLAATNWHNSYIDARAWSAVLWILNVNKDKFIEINNLLEIDQLSNGCFNNVCDTISTNNPLRWTSWEALEGDFANIGYILDKVSPDWSDVSKSLLHAISKIPKEQEFWNPGEFLYKISRSIEEGSAIMVPTDNMKMRFVERLSLWKDSLLSRNRNDILVWINLAEVANGSVVNWFNEPHPNQDVKKIITSIMSLAADEVETNPNYALAIAKLFGFINFEDKVGLLTNLTENEEYSINLGLIQSAFECVNDNEEQSTLILSNMISEKVKELIICLKNTKVISDIDVEMETPKPIVMLQEVIENNNNDEDFDIISAALDDVNTMYLLLEDETNNLIKTLYMTPGWERAVHSLKTIFKTLNKSDTANFLSVVEDWASRKAELNEKVTKLEAIVSYAIKDFIKDFINKGYTANQIVKLNMIPPYKQLYLILPKLEPKLEQKIQKVNKISKKQMPNKSLTKVNAKIADWYKYVPDITIVENVCNEIDESILRTFSEEAEELFEKLDNHIQNLDIGEFNKNIEEINAILHTIKGGSKIAGINKLGDWVHNLEDFTSSINQSISIINYKHILQYSYDKARELYREALEELTGAVADSGNLNSMLLRVDSNSITNIANSVTETKSLLNSNKFSLYGTKNSLESMQNATQRIEMIATEIQSETETWMHSGGNTNISKESKFDALEMDRFSYLNELTRKLFEAASDVTTLREHSIDSLTSALHVADNANLLLEDSSHKLEVMFREPISKIEARLNSVVRSACFELNKKAEIIFSGTSLLIEKNILDTLVPALEHLVRNSVAHGILSDTIRKEQGKPEIGNIYCSTSWTGENFIFEVNDDGDGLNFKAIETKAKKLGLIEEDNPSKEKLCDIIFTPSFSTSEEVNQITGRGVGLDAVAKSVEKLGGTIKVELDGDTTKFVIVVPSDSWTTSGLVIEDNGLCVFIVGEHVDSTELCSVSTIVSQEDGDYIYSDKAENLIKFISPASFYGNKNNNGKSIFVTLVTLKDGLSILANKIRFVDKQTIKPITNMLTTNTGVLGSTLLPEGKVAVVIDIQQLNKNIIVFKKEENKENKEVKHERIVMIVDDSLTVRKATTKLLSKYGYVIEVAENGLVAVEKIKQGLVPNIILMDIEMPIMDGFEATEHIVGLNKNIPIVFISSRAVDKHITHAKQIGAKDFLSKPYNNEELLDVIHKYITVK